MFNIRTAFRQYQRPARDELVAGLILGVVITVLVVPTYWVVSQRFGELTANLVFIGALIAIAVFAFRRQLQGGWTNARASMRKRESENPDKEPPPTPQPAMTWDDTPMDGHDGKSADEVGNMLLSTRLDASWRFGSDLLAPVLIPVGILLDLSVFRKVQIGQILVLVAALFLTIFPFRKMARDTVRETRARWKRTRWIRYGTLVTATLILVILHMATPVNLLPALTLLGETAIKLARLITSMTAATVLVWAVSCVKLAFLLYAWNVERVTATPSTMPHSAFRWDVTQRQGVVFRNIRRAFASNITGVQATPVGQAFTLSAPYATLNFTYTGEEQPIPDIEGIPRKFLPKLGIEDPVTG